ncbi:helix-turn-helix domain-containing protein [Actinoplanes sp. NPDC049599]|uniref:helix-turn-helix domain-containing protein n=1 Tax=Actinoplanes sp. NPDC049599 TaxID=3363903 RepID=UPI00379FC781
MSDQVRQAVARERLRARLVGLRKQSGLSPGTVTRRTHWSTSKLHRIETGAVTVQPVDLEALLQMYGVRDRDEVAELIDLALVSRRRQWWSSYRLDPEYREFVAYESEASRITVYQALLIPGLLQTERYAKAATASIGKKADDTAVQNAIDVRLRRQAELFARIAGNRPPELIALLDGAVLERPIGGADVMRAQLDHLLKVEQQPHVRLVVIPLRHGARPGPGGLFEMLEFSGTADPDVVFVQSPIKDFVVKDPDATAAYHDVVDAIVGSGLTRDAAVEEIRRIRDGR